MVVKFIDGEGPPTEAKADPMLHGGSCPKPSVDLFTADELRVLTDWFKNAADPPTDQILAGADLGIPPPQSSALDVAVAVILLERLQLRHPRLGAAIAPVRRPEGTRFAVQPQPEDRPSSFAPLSRHLLTVRWRDQREEGVFYPSTYTATPVPETDRIVLVASDDGQSSFPVANDVAIGWVSADAEFLGAIGTVIRGEWSRLRDGQGYGRWAAVINPGMFDEDVLGVWADAVWP